ncbi:hypothetical protein [Caballeronia sp. BR00000012568055]|uniref:hypothetical protein n=1 Tax=Caballeronia sp. BR00000012568055 TaxID=2918761 RepID=UPI0023F782EC|nr:hypothetical protein [Caballeronia sp. BR00000012568055]
MQTQEPWNGMALGWRAQGAVIVGSYHELLGALFWTLFNECDECSEGNEVARYVLTANVEHAHRFDMDEVDAQGLLSSAFKSDTSIDQFFERIPPSGRAVISSAVLLRWIASSAWLEINVDSARLPLRQMLATTERDDDAARRPEPIAHWVNHRLEADAAWSEWQLSLRYGLTDVKARQRALKHASMTGWSVAGGGDLADEPCFEQSVELRQAFDRGRALYGAINCREAA